MDQGRATEDELTDPLLIEPLHPSSAAALSSESGCDQLRRRGVSSAPEVPPAVVSVQDLPRPPPRFLDRDAAYFQSRGHWLLQHVSRSNARMHYSNTGNYLRHEPFTKRIWGDWFHNLAAQRTVTIVAIIFCTYTTIVFVFAFLYLQVSLLGQRAKANPTSYPSTLPVCDMDIHDYMEALYFSLSTMASIGYGVSDYYFGGCWTPLLLLLAQLCCSITFDAVAIGLLFQRISRGHKRGKTIVFSNQAVVQRIRGTPYLLFRLGELRRQHQLIEASVRAYCIRHERHPISTEGGTANSGPTLMHPLVESSPHLVETPSDQEGYPQLALAPPPTSTRVPIETTHFVTHPLRLLHEERSAHILMSLPQMLVHEMDSTTSPLRPPGSVWYDIDGQPHSYPWKNQGSRGINDEMGIVDGNSSQEYASEWAETKRYLRDTATEIVVLVEGTDDLTGSAIQTRHSYTVDDIGFDETFVPCVQPYHDDERVDQVGTDLDHGHRAIFSTLARWLSFGARRLEPSLSRITATVDDLEHASAGPALVVDFACFHETRMAPANVQTSPYVPGH